MSSCTHLTDGSSRGCLEASETSLGLGCLWAVGFFGLLGWESGSHLRLNSCCWLLGCRSRITGKTKQEHDPIQGREEESEYDKTPCPSLYNMALLYQNTDCCAYLTICEGQCPLRFGAGQGSGVQSRALAWLRMGQVCSLDYQKYVKHLKHA